MPAREVNVPEMRKCSLLCAIAEPQHGGIPAHIEPKLSFFSVVSAELGVGRRLSPQTTEVPALLGISSHPPQAARGGHSLPSHQKQRENGGGDGRDKRLAVSHSIFPFFFFLSVCSEV